jgi:prepilin-type N-terminal cleavage/methylation domain-containing protein
VLKKKLRNQKGFTLIEIIAVLVILGILAAIAIPKYLDMATDARAKALAGATASLISAASMEYGQRLLNATASASTFTPSAGGYTVGDFSGNVAGTVGIYTATVTGFPAGYNTSNALEGAAATKTFRLFTP